MRLDLSRLVTGDEPVCFSSCLLELPMWIFAVLIVSQLYCVFTTNVETRVSTTEYGHYSLNVSRESGGLVSAFPAYLELDNRYRIQSVRDYRTDSLLRLGVRENICHIPFPESTGHGTFRDGVPLIALGISPDSDFIRFVGSAGIVRRGSESLFVVNLTEEYWENACALNSSLSVPVPPITGGLSFSLLVEANHVQWRDASYTTFFGSHANELMKAPGIIIDGIHDQLARLGAVGVFRIGHLLFRNCTSELVLQLADLVVTWPTIGSLLITAKEYIRHNPFTNMCTVRIGRLPDSSDIIEVSPLRFKELNIRITTRSITFCDPDILD